MENYSEIECPHCGEKILIDPKLLLSGQSMVCSNVSCGTSVSLNQSSYDVTEKAMKEFEKIKKQSQTK